MTRAGRRARVFPDGHAFVVELLRGPLAGERRGASRRRVSAIRPGPLHFDEDRAQRRVAHALFDVGHVFALEGDVPGLCRHGPFLALRGDDHPVARFVIHADEIVEVPVQRRRLTFEPGDVPHLDAVVVEDFRGACAGISGREVRRRRRGLRQQREQRGQDPAHRICLRRDLTAALKACQWAHNSLYLHFSLRQNPPIYRVVALIPTCPQAFRWHRFFRGRPRVWVAQRFSGRSPPPRSGSRSHPPPRLRKARFPASPRTAPAPCCRA